MGGGIRAGWKLVNQAQKNTIWFARYDIDKENFLAIIM